MSRTVEHYACKAAYHSASRALSQTVKYLSLEEKGAFVQLFSVKLQPTPDHYVSSLLCAWGNGMNSIGLSRDNPTLRLVGSGPAKFQGVWDGVSDALQQPPDAVIKEGGAVTLSCFQMGATCPYRPWYKQAQRKDTTLQLWKEKRQRTCVLREESEDKFQNHFKSCGSMGYRLSFSTDFASVDDSGTSYCAKIHIDSGAEEAEHKLLCTESDLMAGEILPRLSLESRVGSDETVRIPKANESLIVGDLHQVLSLWRSVTDALDPLTKLAHKGGNNFVSDLFMALSTTGVRDVPAMRQLHSLLATWAAFSWTFNASASWGKTLPEAQHDPLTEQKCIDSSPSGTEWRHLHIGSHSSEFLLEVNGKKEVLRKKKEERRQEVPSGKFEDPNHATSTCVRDLDSQSPRETEEVYTASKNEGTRLWKKKAIEGYEVERHRHLTALVPRNRLVLDGSLLL
ncbi:hypothetical protein QYF61_000046 [Mycteria americana]|uniref:Ig-like domain-containing protein n=1 Tax=Mycteria americana TaxID=33587 RepID=A0AAN7NQF1_MYCAM|nr:hypothetical protein QYF61_000046 [Mycteria americana]